jgi:hypothetical protein
LPSAAIELQSGDPELLKDVVERPVRYLLPRVAGDRRAPTVGGVEPQLVAAALMVEPRS